MSFKNHSYHHQNHQPRFYPNHQPLFYPNPHPGHFPKPRPNQNYQRPSRANRRLADPRLSPRLPSRTSSPVRNLQQFNNQSRPTPHNNLAWKPDESYDAFKLGIFQQHMWGKVEGSRFPNKNFLSGNINTPSHDLKKKSQNVGKREEYVMVFPHEFDIGDFEMSEFLRRAYETVYDVSTGHNYAFIE